MDLLIQPWQKLYEAAVFAVEHEHWLAAEPLLKQVLEQVPSHAAAHHLLGKVLRANDQLEDALAAQQRSCELDPSLGWNWFAAGELLLELNCWGQSVQAFEHALAAMPSEGWIRNQLASARWLQQSRGEHLADGIGPYTYRYWIKHHEPRLPPASVCMNEQFWSLAPYGEGQISLRALHSDASFQPTPAPLGKSPWPANGWLVLLAEGASLRPGALQAVENWLAGQLPLQGDVQPISHHSDLSQTPVQQPDLIYADEDRLDFKGRRIDPWFKPGWVEESFWSSPWLSGFSLWRMSWLRDKELPLPPSDSQGIWNWMLVALEQQPKIRHIPLILVHAGPSKELSPAPLKRYLERRGERIKSVQLHTQLSGCFQLQWQLPKSYSCSVIIPTRNGAGLLDKCLTSLWSSTAQSRQSGLELEIIVVDNGSDEAAIFALFKQWRERIQVLRCNEPFNWSRLNNLAAAQAKGALLLFLNNDVEAINSGWIEAMAAQAFRPSVGAVGALLLYPDGTIQHGGVVVGMNNSADHAYRNLNPKHNVHRGRSRLLTGWGAVTGACLMIRKELLERLGGLDEGLPVEFNDVDLCVRLSQLGYSCIIPDNVVLTHHESQSRGSHESATAQLALDRYRGRWNRCCNFLQPWWPPQSERCCSDGRPLGLKWIT
ncbi:MULTISPECIES: glycosyltransferase [unclassified Synechococcus]|uniref:glycosyltransferase n=1 Tax=unclassified Synechococcus TaxID=2626047 RepID=UPI0039B0C7AA